MANFARFWKSFSKNEARKGAELPYDALVKIDGTNYHVGNYDSVHDEYSLVTRQDGRTVIKKFPAAQVEGVAKDSKDNEFVEQNQGEDDNEENMEHLAEAKKSNPDPKDDPENRYPEDVIKSSIEQLEDQGYEIEVEIHELDRQLNSTWLPDASRRNLQNYQNRLKQELKEIEQIIHRKERAQKSVGYDGDVGLDETVKTQYKVGDKIMRKGRKYIITEIRSDGKYVLKPASDSRGRDGSWVEEKEIHGHAKKSAKEKDISPYGQAFHSGTLLGAHKGDDTSEYEVKPTHATNVNNMEPTVLENEDDYVVEPTYAMVNDEATKEKQITEDKNNDTWNAQCDICWEKAGGFETEQRARKWIVAHTEIDHTKKKSIEEKIAEVEKAIYSLKTYEKAEKHELYAKHAELSAQLKIEQKNAGIAKGIAVKTAMELNEEQVPTLKEVLKSFTKGNVYQMNDAASEVCERFDVGGFGWIQRATLWLSGKGFAPGDIKTILMKAEENMRHFEGGDTSSY